MASRSINNILILGSTGFIGTALTHFLQQQDYRLHCLIHRQSPAFTTEDVRITRGSLTDIDWTRFNDSPPDVIYHLARMPGQGRKGRLRAARQNKKANQRLIRWIASLEDPPLLVFFSGTLVYGSRGVRLIDETASLRPISFQREYVIAEKPVLRACQFYDIPVMIMRPPWVYGPGSWFSYLYASSLQQNQAVPLFGAGDNYMSLIHVDDCVRLAHHYTREGPLYQIYNLTGHSPVRQKEFATTLSDLSGLSLQQYPYWWLLLFRNRTFREAVTFSLKVTTKHRSLRNQYSLQYPTLEEGLRTIL